MHCTQCGGPLHRENRRLFIQCPHCQSTLYIIPGRTVLHRYLPAALDADQAQAALRGWMAGREMPTDLSSLAKIEAVEFAYFPMWRVQLAASGQDPYVHLPAAATAVTEINMVRIPAGDLRPFDPGIQPTPLAPTFSLETALAQRSANIQDRVGEVDLEHIREVELVHVPLFFLRYRYRRQRYTAVVEGFSGQVYAHIYPQASNRPLVRASVIVAVIYFALGTCPWIGLLVGGRAGQRLGLALCLGLGVAVSIPSVIYMTRLAEGKW